MIFPENKDGTSLLQKEIPLLFEDMEFFQIFREAGIFRYFF